MFAVIDRITNNVLGEFETAAEAETMYRELLEADEHLHQALELVEAVDEELPHDQVLHVPGDATEPAKLFHER